MKQNKKSWSLVRVMVCIVMLLLAWASNLQVRAQTFPYWDNQPDVDLAYASPAPSYFEAGVGCGQNIYFIDDISDSVFGWNETDGWWLVGSANDIIRTITVNGHYLYVGGAFSEIGGTGNSTNALNVAKFDLNTGLWNAVGNNNLGREVFSMILDDAGTAYVGCWATDSEPGLDLCSLVSTNMLLKYNGSKWVTLGKGMEMGSMGCGDTNCNCFELYVSALATDGTNIFAAGGFSGGWQTGGSFIYSHGIIKWDGTSWVQMGVNATHMLSTFTGVFEYFTNNYDGAGTEEITDPCALAIVGTNLFVAGPFIYPHPCLARFSTISGDALGCDDLFLSSVKLEGNAWPVYNLDENPTFGLVVHDGQMYLAGCFDHVGSVAANGIASWTDDGSANGSWSALGSGLTLSGSVYFGAEQHLAANDSAVFAASLYGTFDSAGGISLPNRPAIARLITDPSDISFTSGTMNSLGMVANAPNYYQTNVFSFGVSGTPDTVWTVYGCNEGPGGPWNAIGTIALDDSANGGFTDTNSGMANPAQEFYQLGRGSAATDGVNCPGNQHSDMFGYDAYGAMYGNSFDPNTPISNPLAPLTPTVDGVLNTGTMFDGSGNNWTPPTDTDAFFDDSTDPYDHPWTGSSWDSGGYSYGFGDSIELDGFDGITFYFIGILPPGYYGLY
jgi:hypothetical protein